MDKTREKGVKKCLFLSTHGGGWFKKWQNSVQVVVECPPMPLGSNVYLAKNVFKVPKYLKMYFQLRQIFIKLNVRCLLKRLKVA